MNRLTLCLLLLAAPLLAQERGAVSYIQYLENEVSIVPADGSGALQAGLNIPLYPGDRLDTSRSGRLEAALADGSLLWLDQGSQVELRALARTDGFSDQRSYLFVGEGHAALEALWDPERGQEPVLGFSGGDFYAFAAGLYSVELRGRAAYLRLFSGRGELVTDRGSVLLQAGEEAIAYEDGFVDRRRLRREGDGFASWVERRRELRLRSESSQYTGEALSSYSYQLDQNGSWVYIPDISGYAWRPVVTVGWQPYYNGYWRSSPSGWFWVGYEPWGYVTYHYGRWSWFPGHGWMWVPGYEWAPAWVYWYWDPFNIGWCPVGYWDYWWYAGCHQNCWGWDNHHGHGHGDHDGDHGSDHGHGDYHHINGHVRLAGMDHKPFVFTPVGQFGKGQKAFIPGSDFKGRLDGNGTLRALDLPLRHADLDNPIPSLKQASLEVKDDLTPLFKKDFTVTPQVRQILSSAQARPATADSPAGQGVDRSPSPRGGEPRTVTLPQGQSPKRQPMHGRSVTSTDSGVHSTNGNAAPAPGGKIRERNAVPNPSESGARPSGGSITPSPTSPTPSGSAPRSSGGTVSPGPSTSSPRPSSGHSPSPAPSPAPASPAPSVKSAPAPAPTPSPAPSDPKEIKPGKSGLMVTNLRDSGNPGTLRIEDPNGRLLSRIQRTEAAPATESARWERSRSPVSVSTSSVAERRPVEPGSTTSTRAPSTYDRQSVSVPSSTRAYRSSEGNAYPSAASYHQEAASSRPPSVTSSSNAGRTYPTPSRSYSPSAGSGRSYSSPAPSSGSGHVVVSSSHSSSGKSASSTSSSGGSSSSHSSPKK